MKVTLTPEQSQQISENRGTFPYVVDPASRRMYVLLGTDVLERMRALFGEASFQDALSPAWADVPAGMTDYID